MSNSRVAGLESITSSGRNKTSKLASRSSEVGTRGCRRRNFEVLYFGKSWACQVNLKRLEEEQLNKDSYRGAVSGSVRNWFIEPHSTTKFVAGPHPCPFHQMALLLVSSVFPLSRSSTLLYFIFETVAVLLD